MAGPPSPQATSWRTALLVVGRASSRASVCHCRAQRQSVVPAQLLEKALLSAQPQTRLAIDSGLLPWRRSVLGLSQCSASEQVHYKRGKGRFLDTAVGERKPHPIPMPVVRRSLTLVESPLAALASR